MNRLCAFLLVSCFILGLLSLIGADTNADDKGDSRRSAACPTGVALPRISLPGWSSFGSHAGYAKMDELARTFWAHFPSASRLGYEVPEPEE